MEIAGVLSSRFLPILIQSASSIPPKSQYTNISLVLNRLLFFKITTFLGPDTRQPKIFKELPSNIALTSVPSSNIACVNVKFHGHKKHPYSLSIKAVIAIAR